MEKTEHHDASWRENEARALMMKFLQRTGITSAKAEKRYLWTDAFAVCNLLGLGEEKLALSLIEQVHGVLGKHRIDDKRKGWLSGLSEKEARLHPTIAGLRIGKSLPERGPNEPVDDSLEWERDGQYYHYLTKWMHALDQVARKTRDIQYHVWARELAAAAQAGFTYRSVHSGQLRMYWKMSIDLTYPLIFSQGQHDPLDGFITYNQLRATAVALNCEVDLSKQCDQLEKLMNQGDWNTSDPLGIGGLLTDAFRVYQLMLQEGHVFFKDKGWQLVKTLLDTASRGLEDYLIENDLKKPAQYRLAFRELGLCIGIHAIELMVQTAMQTQEDNQVAPIRKTAKMLLMKYHSMGKEIEDYWRKPKHREGITWQEHQDINDVMLATCLAPNGFLVLSYS